VVNLNGHLTVLLLSLLASTNILSPQKPYRIGRALNERSCSNVCEGNSHDTPKTLCNISPNGLARWSYSILSLRQHVRLRVWSSRAIVFTSFQLRVKSIAKQDDNQRHRRSGGTSHQTACVALLLNEYLKSCARNPARN
jgi:hypothetical protein